MGRRGRFVRPKYAKKAYAFLVDREKAEATFSVAPAHQGKGYGRALTEFCMNLLAERGHAHPRTSVLVNNLPARRLYYGLGFELVQTNEWACRRLGL